MIESITRTELKLDIFELCFSFSSKNISDCNLHTSTMLGYTVETENDSKFELFQFDSLVYGSHDPNDYFHFSHKDKEQVFFLFIPAILFEDETNPEPIFYDKDFNLI